MAGTAANPSAFDPLDDMPADEPRFVLRGRDPAAPDAITEWARVRRNVAIKAFNAIEEPTEQDRLALKGELAQCREADERAMTMREWQQNHAPASGVGRATYNEIERTQEQLVELERGKKRETAVRHIQEGRYHFCEARDLLLDLALIGPETGAEISGWLDRAQEFDHRYSVTNDAAAPQPSLPLAAAGQGGGA